MNIMRFIHCAQCIHECPDGVSPSNYQQLEIGFTDKGIQVWCKRHHVNVIHVDMEGAKHPIDVSAAGEFGKYAIH